MTLGEKIREARKSAGLTQQQLADKVTEKKFTIGEVRFKKMRKVD